MEKQQSLFIWHRFDILVGCSAVVEIALLKVLKMPKTQKRDPRSYMHHGCFPTPVSLLVTLQALYGYCANVTGYTLELLLWHYSQTPPAYRHYIPLLNDTKWSLSATGHVALEPNLSQDSALAYLSNAKGQPLHVWSKCLGAFLPSLITY